MNIDDTSQSKMNKAYKISSNLVRNRLILEDEMNAKRLERISESDIIVVRGTYDHIHLVLKSLNIPFIEIDEQELRHFKLNPRQTVFVNCASSNDPQTGRILSTFVNEGGQLITTDWALKHVIEVGFPGYIKYNEKPTADEVVRIEIVDRDNPILKGFLDEEKDTEPLWWLEGSSYPIEIIDTERVNVLVRSKEIGEKYGADPVIVHFQYGKGNVYHMISHFYLQRTETRDKKQAAPAAEYAKAKKAPKEVVDVFEEAEGLDYGSVQSATTSAEFINRMIIEQQKRYEEEEK
ncbi:MAG: hypothetical protein D6732_18540 [Methanobacteriota archaeon]|nr:MAG: hypothetical protein D6732_18540 [Euryarchaeota archaeon]